jgi:hypothetical protein
MENSFDVRGSFKDTHKIMEKNVRSGLNQVAFKTSGNRYITKKQEELELGIQKNNNKKGLLLSNLMMQKHGKP